MTVSQRESDLASELTRLYAGEREALERAPVLYARLQAEAPVLRAGPLTAVSRYEDVLRVYGDAVAFSSTRGSGSRQDEHRSRLFGERRERFEVIMQFLDHWVAQMDAPDHTRIRGIVQRSFTPRRVSAMRATIQDQMDQLLMPIDERGHVDLVREFARPLPLLVICRMLGLDDRHIASIYVWAHEIARALGTNFSNIDEMYDAIVGFEGLVRRLIAERRAEPVRLPEEQDLFDTLVAATTVEDGLSESEVVTMVTMLLFAGHETTTNLIASGIVALVQNRDQLQLLRQQPELMPGAVDELLRFRPPVLGSHRTVVREATIGDARVVPGETLLVMIAAANRDPSMFPDPDRFDVTRENSARHMGMGYGVHTCLGIWLAKLEGELALTTLVGRYPQAELAGPVELAPTFLLSGYEEVPLRLRPGLQYPGHAPT